jgi:hypothetical protein
MPLPPTRIRSVLAAARPVPRNGKFCVTPRLPPNNIADGHDVISLGIDGDGYMHLSWGMHGDASTTRAVWLQLPAEASLNWGRKPP